MRFRVLGPVTVVNRGGQLSLGGKQQRLVLALLLAHEGVAISTDRLVDDLWGGEPPETARKIVHGYIHHLRRIVGGLLETKNGGYRLNVSEVGFDSRDFESAVASALRDSPSADEISERLTGALAMWRGRPYADVADAIALRAEITRLNELRLSALERRIDADIESGGGKDLIGELRSLVSEYPLREHFTAQLMRSLYRGGRRTEALRAFDRARTHLAEQVGLEPSTELTELRDRIVDQSERSIESGGNRRSFAIRGYELRGTLTPGQQERTDLGFQASVGRQVSIRVFEGPFVNRADFIAAFASDAGAIARLVHPHLVPVTDYWREPGRAYVVSPWFEGGSLTQRSLTGAAFEQVASALSHAHRQHVAHGRLTPADVVFDLAGNAYLGGFGIAPSALRRGGEHREFETLIRADIEGLAEILLDHAPSSWRENREIQEIASKGRSANSSHTYQRVDDMLRDFRRATGRDVVAMSGLAEDDRSDLRNPFKGLRSFHESDAADFFGRSDVVEAVVELLSSRRLVAVVGPSGSGKSSLLKAGVIPEMRARASADGENLLVVEMYPGSHPFEEMESALLRVAATHPEFDQLTADDSGLLRVAKAILPEGAHILIVIDQFEELFSLVADESNRSLFLSSLERVIEDSHVPVSVAITLRADYFDRPLEYPGFAGHMEGCIVPMTPLSVDGMRRAVSGPSRRVGLDLEPGLVTRMVTDLEGQPGSLPLLQYALTEMFDQRKSDMLSLETYDRIGGISGALAGRAETIFEELDAEGREALRQCFLRLVTIDADRNDVRRRVKRAELNLLPVNQSALEEAIRRFGASRLLSFDRDPQTSTPTVEVAHEALLREWDRLRTWIESQRSDLIRHRALVTEIEQWEESHRDESYLLRGGRLAEFEDWADTSSINLTARESEYLARSGELRNEENEKEGRNRRRIRGALAVVATLAVVTTLFGIVALTNWQTARQQAQIAEQQRKEAEGSSAAAAAAAEEALQNESAAVASEKSARVEAFAASSTAALDSDPELALLLGIEALAIDPTSRSANDAVNEAYQAHRTIWRVGDSALIGGSLSPDGSMIAYATSHQMELFAAEGSPTPVWSWAPPEEHTIFDAHFTSDGRFVVTGLGWVEGPCAVDRWVLLDASSGAVVSDNTFQGLLSYFGGPAQNGPFVDQSRPMILGEGGRDNCQANPAFGRVVAVDLLTGGERELGEGVGRTSSFRGIPSVSEPGDRMALGLETAGVVVDMSSGEVLLELRPGLTSLNRDGSLVLAGNNPIELWDVDAGEKLREFKANFVMAWFSPSETMVYGATSEGDVVVFDILNGDLLFELRGHRGVVRTVQMSDDEEVIASFGDDGARLWDIGAPLLSTASQVAISATVDDERAVFQVPDSHVVGDLVITKRGVCVDPGCDLTPEFISSLLVDTTTIYDLESGNPVVSYTGGFLAVHPSEDLVALQTTGEPVVVEGADGLEEDHLPYAGIVIADLLTGETIVELEGLCRWYTKQTSAVEIVESDGCSDFPGPWRDYAHAAAFSPDGSLLAMAGSTGRYAVWDVATGAMIWSRDSVDGTDEELLSLHTNVAFTPDGNHLLLAHRATIEVLEVAALDSVVSELATEGGAPVAIEFTPDGALVVFADALVNVHVASTNNWERTATFTGHRGRWFLDVAVDPSGRYVSSAGLDNEARVWDLTTGGEVQKFTATPIAGGLRNVDWVDEETILLGNRRWAVLMTFEPEVLLENAKARLTRTFTAVECATYGIEPCPVPARN